MYCFAVCVYLCICGIFSGQAGPDEWLIVDKHMVDISSGRRQCNKLGTNSIGFVTQPNKCRQETGS